MALQEKSKQSIEQYREKVAENIGQVDKPDELLTSSMKVLEKIGGFGYSAQILMKRSSLFENPEDQKYLKKFLAMDIKELILPTAGKLIAG